MKRRLIGAGVLVVVLAGCGVPAPTGQAAPSFPATTAAQAPTTPPTPVPATPTAFAAPATPTLPATATTTATAAPSSRSGSTLPPNLGTKRRSPKASAAPPTPPTPTSPPPAQPTPTPPQGQPPATDTPTEVVINFLRSVQQALNTPGNTQYLSSTLAQRVANGETVGTLLNVGDDPDNLYIDFSAGNFLLGSSGVATVDATLQYNNGSVTRAFQLVDEGNGWTIDSMEDTTPPEPPLNPDPSQADPPTPTLVSAAVAPINTVQAYIGSLIADPSGASSGQYLSPDVPNLPLDAFIGQGTLINYQGVPLDDGTGSTATVQWTFSTDEDNFVYTFGLERAGQAWFISAIN